MKSEKYKFKRISLNFKFLLTILPVIIFSLIISSYLSNLIYKKSIIRTGVEFTGYKARQLIKYSDLQWTFLMDNNLAGNDSYIKTVKDTIEIYAANMITGDGEIILALLPDGEIDFSTKEISVSDDEISDLVNHLEKNSGWINVTLSGISRTGYYFIYEPFNWTVFILQDSKLFFRAVSLINRQQIIFISISMILSLMIITFLVKHMTDPLKKVVNEVTGFSGISSDLVQIDIDFPDEIGELAYEFNIMNLKLKKSYYKLKDFALQEAAARNQVVSREIETLEILGTASDYRDPETGSHIARVGYYSRLLASCHGETEESQERIFLSSPLHDIGKLGIPDSLLLKPGRLTASEYEIIKTHTTIGYEILKNSKSWYLRAGGEISLTHHEKYDGTGYPSGLKGNNIPLYGRIVGISDVFDALTSRRPYKEPWPLQKAFDYIESEAGKSFDPVLAAGFIENRKTVESIFYENQES